VSLDILYSWCNDPKGTVHFFAISFNSCNGGPVVATTTHGSGYTMSADIDSAVVYPASGGKSEPPLQGPSGVGLVFDRNVNFFSSNVSGSTTFTDTLGTTVLTVSGSGTPTSPMQYTYTSPANKVRVSVAGRVQAGHGAVTSSARALYIEASSEEYSVYDTT
jgi:hypothetical protein